ncbi:hypothetical protein FS749_008073 [Ceratobasidium sp. UAMH 11750]|nr:hypothetical protein FS749_008073 [Ceratobasidium sp. UAMH 11750]
MARQERAARFQKFVDAQGGSAGTQNFFFGLHAAMRLQTLPPSIGGTGEGRIEWEIDDAVFMESGGNQFMLEAVDMMKGVLGFDERPLNYRPLPSRAFHHRPSYSSPTNVVSSYGDRSEDSPSSETPITRPLRSAPLARSRASSDPFLDPTRSSPSMHAALSMALPTPEESATDLDSLGPSTPLDERGPEIPPPPASLPDPYQSSAYSMNAEAFLNEPQLRIWTFPPYLTNPELHKLIAMLPPSITSQPVPRFKPLGKPKRRERKRKAADVDLEGEGNPMQTADITSVGADLAKERGEIRKGTGRMWIGDLVRLPGWRGTFWDSVRDWFRHLFG